MSAQEGPTFEMGSLSGSEVPTDLYAPPATPVEGEAAWRGEWCSSTPSLHCPPSTPGKGDGGRRGEEVRADGGVDRLICWGLALLLPPPPQVGGGLLYAGGCQGESLLYWESGPHPANWWLAAN